MNESEIAALIGTRDGHTIASRFLQLLDSGELDPAKDQEVDSAAERITDEVVAESAKKYGPDTIFVEGDAYVFAAREAVHESLSRGGTGLILSQPETLSNLKTTPRSGGTLLIRFPGRFFYQK